MCLIIQLDIGYACSSALGAPLLYGDADRGAPCAVQNYDVQFAIRMFALLLPGVCFLLCCIPLKMMKITNKQHEAIMHETAARQHLVEAGLQVGARCCGLDH